ncbi:Y-family DNA polymerase [Alkalisalibacterium limincola]|uniref:DNA polymerase Y family protein n=1 Tax=Alkalisalibacterium limincola TaxID=2699169 RepID=A0A5C8KY02_9GAMM|nr:DNA polymerase Y family protein [Alkalisalibacterium limincola]TXK65667.1 DNA polymerase Y family protein [Alkalisalibacterium limincola]
MELWACFALPRLSLEMAWGPACGKRTAADRDRAGPIQEDAEAFDPDAAHAVIDGPVQRALIVDADERAEAAGITRGMSPAQAQALRPDLRLRRRDARAEAGRLETLGALAYGFSSQVLLAPPATVLLEVGASLRLFGGWPALQRGVRERLDALGHVHAIAAAPTPAAAEVFAWLADGFAVFDETRLLRALRRVPIEAAGLDAKALRSVSQLGVRRLGELMALPRPGLQRRYGPGVLERLDRLQGRLPDPRPAYRPAERFERRIEFDYGIVSSQALAFPLRRLVDELASYLQLRDGGVPGFELRFEHEGAEDSRRWIGLRKPMREAAALLDAARGRLEQVRLPHPAQALALVAETCRRSSRNCATCSTRARAAGWISMRWWSACAHDWATRRCGRWRCRPSTVPSAPGGWPSAAMRARPACRRARPGCCRRRCRCASASSACSMPPERIETGWWDGDDVRREYVVAELEGGQRAWLFRQVGGGELVDAAQERHWMLHGWFA